MFLHTPGYQTVYGRCNEQKLMKRGKNQLQTSWKPTWLRGIITTCDAVRLLLFSPCEVCVLIGMCVCVCVSPLVCTHLLKKKKTTGNWLWVGVSGAQHHHTDRLQRELSSCSGLVRLDLCGVSTVITPNRPNRSESSGHLVRTRPSKFQHHDLI